MSEYDEDMRDAEATVMGEQVRQALASGALTFTDYSEDEVEQVVAALPTDLDQSIVPTSVRLPYWLHQKLKAYADERNTRPSVLIREWIEQMLTTPDKSISYADAVRALAALPARTTDERAAA
jgi:predicted DNA-binding protein